MSHASTIEVKSADPAAGEYCAVIVSKELDKNGHSKVLAKSCSHASGEDAHHKARSEHARASNSPVSAFDETLLLNEYQDANYGGGVIYSFYGTAGGCDSSGYHLVNYWSVENNVSSMQGYNNCNRVKVHTEKCDASETNCDWGYFNLDVPYLGDYYNDNVVALQVYNG
ncbi:hypothetical protein GCM10023192_39520 [Amycolatopsis samaneae]